MKFSKVCCIVIISSILFFSCDSASTKSIIDSANSIINPTNTGSNPLSNEEVIKGLKEALTVGTNNSALSASKIDGYLKNQNLFIPFPPEANKMKQKLIDIGLQNKVTEFETSLNRAAEEAAKKAAPIFVNAITNMSIQDGFTILKGGDTSATQFLRQKTYQSLVEAFKPSVKEAIQKVEVTKYWNPLVTAYNKIPLVEKFNPDLDSYVTNLAAQGLFKLVREEESKIRKDPAARVSEILKRVFGSPEAQGK